MNFVRDGMTKARTVVGSSGRGKRLGSPHHNGFNQQVVGRARRAGHDPHGGTQAQRDAVLHGAQRSAAEAKQQDVARLDPRGEDVRPVAENLIGRELLSDRDRFVAAFVCRHAVGELDGQVANQPKVLARRPREFASHVADAARHARRGAAGNHRAAEVGQGRVQ